MNETDVKKDFEAAYDEAASHWDGFVAESKKDLAAFLGDQWDPVDKAYLASQRRTALVFNKIHRVVKLIEGYQRKNRLSLRVEPVEGADGATAGQLSAVLLWQLSYGNGYNVLSDAFAGALVTGMNLVRLSLDYADDPLNGDIRVKRLPYNRFLLDPAFTERDLSDCNHVLTRHYADKFALAAMLPAHCRKAALSIRPRGADGKYPQGPRPHGMSSEGLFRVDEFFRRTASEVTVLLDPSTGQAARFEGDDSELSEILLLMPHLSVFSTLAKGVSHSILVEGELVHSGPEPTGLGDFPFVPVMCFWNPESEDPRRRLQGIVRNMRDPQAEINRRRSKMLDYMDSQIASGWIVKDGSVVNREALYGSGQGRVIWMNSQNQPSDAQRIQPPEIPAGLFQLADILDKDIMEIPGANSELMGMPEAGGQQVAGILSKLRQASGLTILQDIFDNYRLAKKIVGQKMIRMIQENYGPEKIRRIMGSEPSAEFYTKDFGKYDALPVEGVLSDTQRQVHFAQLVEMKKLGAPIPWDALIEASPLENREKLLGSMRNQALAQEARSQAEARRKDAGALAQVSVQQALLASQARSQKIQETLAAGRLRADLAQAAERLAEARKTCAETAIEKARAEKELSGAGEAGFREDAQ